MMSAGLENAADAHLIEDRCTFCGLVAGPSRRMVRSPSGNALICRACAETVLTAIDANPREDRRHTIVGACCWASMILLGIILVWHFLLGSGEDRIIGCVAAGTLLVMGLLPTYVIIFRGSKI